MAGPLNLQSAQHEVVQVQGMILIGWGYGTPTASTVGYLPGALYIDTQNAKHYKNTGTAAAATWTEQTT
jgi:hypothetical protein